MNRFIAKGFSYFMVLCHVFFISFVLYIVYRYFFGETSVLREFVGHFEERSEKRLVLFITMFTMIAVYACITGFITTIICMNQRLEEVVDLLREQSSRR
jgi:hypothetical protein